MGILVITEGKQYYKAGYNFIIGDEWIKEHDMKMQICGASLSAIYIYKQIELEDFMYALSRLRIKSAVEQLPDKSRKCVSVVTLCDISFGRDKISWDEIEYDTRIEVLKQKWFEYWS